LDNVLEDGTWNVLYHHWKKYQLKNDVANSAQFIIYFLLLNNKELLKFLSIMIHSWQRIWGIAIIQLIMGLTFAVFLLVILF
jgi:hypothetical protein